MAHVLCQDLMTELFYCGTCSVVLISVHLRDIPVLFSLLRSPLMAHMLCQDRMIELFDFGTQSVVSISVHLRDIPGLLPQLRSPPTAHVLCQDLGTTHCDCGI